MVMPSGMRAVVKPRKSGMLEQEQKGLYIIGDMDTVFRPSLRKELKQVEHWIVLEQCGHICNVDKPDVVNDLLCAFQDTGMVQAAHV